MTTDQVGNRFDAARHTALDLAGQADALNRDNKVADCLVKAQEAAKAAGVAMNK